MGNITYYHLPSGGREQQIESFRQFLNGKVGYGTIGVLV